MPVGVESPGKRHCGNSQKLERTRAQKGFTTAVHIDRSGEMQINKITNIN